MTRSAPMLERPPPPAPAKLAPGEVAWLAAAPCAVLAIAAIALLGPPLGDAVFAPGVAHFWPRLPPRPEPAEHARYLIAVLAPLALSGVVALAARRSILRSSDLRWAIRATEALVLGFAVFAVLSPHFLTYRGAIGLLYGPLDRRVYFTPATLVVAAALAGLLALLLRRPRALARVQASARETPARRAAFAALAVAYVALWMLTAFNTEATIGRAPIGVYEDVALWLDETFAVLNHAYPLVSFHPQYSNLWPYVTASAMRVFGASLGVYSAVMIVATTAVMLAVYATLRRVARNSALALALFAPFVATSFFKMEGSLANRYGPSNLFSLFPMRYGAAFALAWLLSRLLDGRAPRRPVALFALAGLATLSTPEFGAAAFAATFAACLWTLPRRGARDAGRLAASAALGALTALAAVAALTLTVAGSLPRLGMLTQFTRLYAIDGFGMLPMPTFGLHLAIYLTYAAAIVLATVRAMRRDQDRVLTGLLCWIGVFGLGVGGYYAGRSHPEVLIDMFSPWAFALALLLVASLRAILARPVKRPTAAELAVFAGCALTVCSVAQTPTPWSQVERLRHTTTRNPVRPPEAERFVAERTQPGERVAIVGRSGYRFAYDLALKQAFPYANWRSMITLEQWTAVDRSLREQQVHKLFLANEFLPEIYEAAIAAGWRDAGHNALTIELVR